jgi:uncharacterized RDD family membrane protein YckC
MADRQQPEQTELLTPPAWGMAFPPEQPRRDLDESEAAGLPTAAAVAAAAAIGEEAPADFTHEDRRSLDGRRIKAYLIDILIIVPLAILAVQLGGGPTPGAGLMAFAVNLTYFFVFETLRGQTIGKRVARLRVVRPDGSAASASKIAARTIARVFDYSVLGPITLVATGKRRQRLGDLVAGTIVRSDNRSFVRAPESPLIVVYPLLWIGAAAIAMVTFKPLDPMLAARSHDPYMARIDRICEKRVRQQRALEAGGQLDLISGRLLLRQEERKIEKLPAPPSAVCADVRDVISRHRQVNAELDRMMSDIHRSPRDPSLVAEDHRPAIESLMSGARDRYRSLGLPYCAS